MSFLIILFVINSFVQYGDCASCYPETSSPVRLSGPGISGQVHLLSDKMLLIKDFTYDGKDPKAVFRSLNGIGQSIVLTINRQRTHLKEKFEIENILLTSPTDLSGTKVSIIPERGNPYATVSVPPSVDINSFNLGSLIGDHGVNSNKVEITSPTTIVFHNLTYDGKGPAAFFLVGKDAKPSKYGKKVPFDGMLNVLPQLKNEEVTLELPADMTFLEVQWISMYCLQADRSFAHKVIPHCFSMSNSLYDSSPAQQVTTQVALILSGLLVALRLL